MHWLGCRQRSNQSSLTTQLRRRLHHAMRFKEDRRRWAKLVGHTGAWGTRQRRASHCWWPPRAVFLKSLRLCHSPTHCNTSSTLPWHLHIGIQRAPIRSRIVQDVFSRPGWTYHLFLEEWYLTPYSLLTILQTLLLTCYFTVLNSLDCNLCNSP